MKKIYIVDYNWEKRAFLIFNNLKKYLKEEIFVNFDLTQKQIKNELSLLIYKKLSFQNFTYKLWNLYIYDILEWESI